MAKKITGYVKLQIPAGEATPAPPVGPALGQQGVNIMDFCKSFNAKTVPQKGLIIPVVITVYADRSYSFITKTPPAAILLLKAAGVAEGLGHAQQGEGRQGDEAAGRGDRQDQDAGPERRGPPGRHPGDRGHRALHGNRSRLTSTHNGSRGTVGDPANPGSLARRRRTMPKSGKKFLAAKAKVEARPYVLADAVKLVRDMRYAKFDESVDLAMLLGVDPKHADQMVRGTVVLPHGTGKSKRVAVIAGTATSRRKRRRRARTTSGPRTWSRRSRAASSTSRPSSRRPT